MNIDLAEREIPEHLREFFEPVEVRGLKAKDLVGVPFRVAFALQADGWYLRNDSQWVKDNAMPESVTDRMTVAHEYLFLLSKSSRYFYDADAVREPVQPQSIARGGRREKLIQSQGVGALGKQQESLEQGGDYAFAGLANGRSGSGINPAGRNRRTSDVWRDSIDYAIARTQAHLRYLQHLRDDHGLLLAPDGEPLTLHVNPKGYKGAHFAVFPEALVEPCIKAGTSEYGVCPSCGKPWERVTKQTGHVNKREAAHVPGNTDTKVDSTGWAPTTYATNEWLPTCDCYGGTTIPRLPGMPDEAEAPQYCEVCGGEGEVALWGFAAGRIVRCSACGGRGITKKPNRVWTDWQASCETIRAQRADLVAEYVDKPTVPATVLDPFVGSGTTLVVARQLGRGGIGLDLSEDYLSQQARKRLELDKLAAWGQRGGNNSSGSLLEELPLFSLQPLGLEVGD